ncbi:unnamed protein product [Lepeophtheirus salmonis]|uniref:(salmon louse) hypothetical protein n=1 Tax=Lepeophtheirus salmonis TaxID=72036 RepID=A0A7R8CE25_LEPSM|nr:unnamed protein product [Lepeophtheirus salmonis]CAF2791418.1 unnamed protein product [Lepeophtheirus salmonis]
MVVLIFLNMNIYLKIRSTKKFQSARRRTPMNRNNSFPLKTSGEGLVVSPESHAQPEENETSSNNSNNNVPTRRDIKMALILSLIVMLFFFSHLPRHFALVINSSINILIYCSVGDNFIRRLLTKSTKGVSIATTAGVSRPSHTIVQYGECQL